MFMSFILWRLGLKLWWMATTNLRLHPIATPLVEPFFWQNLVKSPCNLTIAELQRLFRSWDIINAGDCGVMPVWWDADDMLMVVWLKWTAQTKFRNRSFREPLCGFWAWRMATKTACFSDHGFPRPSPAQPLDETDLDSEMGLSFARQISPNCRLVDCKVPSPTCADAPDDTRLEFKDFKRQAQSLSWWVLFAPKMWEGWWLQCAVWAAHPSMMSWQPCLLRASLDQKDATRQAVIPLLLALHEEELMSTAQLARGFEKLVLSWEDLQLDVPGAPGLLVSLLSSRVGLFDKEPFCSSSRRFAFKGVMWFAE